MNDHDLDTLLIRANPVRTATSDPVVRAALDDLRDEITATSRLRGVGAGAGDCDGEPIRRTRPSASRWIMAVASVGLVAVGVAAALAVRGDRATPVATSPATATAPVEPEATGAPPTSAAVTQSEATVTATVTVMDPEYWEHPRTTRLTVVGDDVEEVIGWTGECGGWMTRTVDGVQYTYVPSVGWEEAITPPDDGQPPITQTFDEMLADVGAEAAANMPPRATYPTVNTPAELLADLEAVTEFDTVGPEVVDGVPTTHLHAESPSEIALERLRTGSATSGLMGVRSLDLWVTDDGMVVALHATLFGDPTKPLVGEPPWVRVEFSAVGGLSEPIVKPNVGEPDPAADALVCEPVNVPNTSG